MTAAIDPNRRTGILLGWACDEFTTANAAFIRGIICLDGAGFADAASQLADITRDVCLVDMQAIKLADDFAAGQVAAAQVAAAQLSDTEAAA